MVCSWANICGVSTVPFGSSGPDSVVNRPEESSEACAVRSVSGCSHIGWVYVNTRSEGLATAAGKWAKTIALPVASSEPGGAVIVRPTAADRYPSEQSASATSTSAPAPRIRAGCRTVNAETLCQTLSLCRACSGSPPLGIAGNTIEPNRASSAGSSVSPASRATAIPMASGTPRS